MSNENNKKKENIFGWMKNPFTFKILPEIFIGYEDEIELLSKRITDNSKVVLLLGPTGSGKTTLLKYLMSNNIDAENVIFLPKPPRNPNDFLDIFLNFTKGNFLRRILSRDSDVNLYNLSDSVNKKIGEDEIIMIIDEAHESTTDTMEWLRTISDQISNMTLVMAGLPVLENKMKGELETFYRRVDTSVKLTNLSKIETRELIKRRIEWAGGNDIKPFTARMIDHIYDRTGGFPREILRTCNDYANDAIKSKITMIDIDNDEPRENVVNNTGIRNDKKVINEISTEKKSEKRPIFETIEDMPEKQRNIVDILISENRGLTPTEIVSRMSVKDYKNKDNAIRSVNNILRRMGSEGTVIRDRKGKAYRYILSEKLRTAAVKT